MMRKHIIRQLRRSIIIVVLIIIIIRISLDNSYAPTSNNASHDPIRKAVDSFVRVWGSTWRTFELTELHYYCRNIFESVTNEVLT